MSASQKEKIFQLETKVSELRSEMDVLLNWISYKFGNEHGFPTQFQSFREQCGIVGIKEEPIHEEYEDGDDFKFDYNKYMDSITVPVQPPPSFSSPAPDPQNIQSNSNDISTSEKSFKCSICPKTFSRRNTLNTHIQLHTGEKEFKCLECGNNFTRKQHLVRHHNNVHTLNQKMNQRPPNQTPNPNIGKHVCTTCGKIFIRRDHLTRHARGHIGLKPYNCKICNKSFGRIDCLNDHYRGFHKIDKEEFI